MGAPTYFCFHDEAGNTIECCQFEAKGTTAYAVEVTNEAGEVKDSYTLYGYEAVMHTAKKRRWEEVRVK